MSNYKPPVWWLAAVVALVAVITVGQSAVLAGETIVTLDLKEPSGVARENWPITTGVPLPQGLVSADQVESGLMLLDAAGKPMPAQFQVQSRWIDGKSVRWLLIDTQATLKPNELATVTLARRAKDDKVAATPRLEVTDAAESLTIATGPLKFVVGKKAGFRLFDEVWLDLKGDGKLEQMVKPSANDGPGVHEVETGKWHRSAGSPPKNVSIETAGPMRVVVRIDGTHAVAGGVAGGCYDYTCRLYAFAGQQFVQVQYTLKNLRWQRPFRSYGFDELSIATTLALTGKRTWTIGDEKQAVHETLEGDVSIGRVYQDSSGGEGWNKTYANGNMVWPDGVIPGVAFRGYEIINDVTKLSSGDFAPGWIDLSDDRSGMAVAIRDFAGQYPIALEAKGKGIVAKLVAPYGQRKLHFLPANQARTFNLLYMFHAGPADAAKLANAVTAFNEPAMLLPSAKWVADTVAWDCGLTATEASVRTWQRGPKPWHAAGRGAGFGRFGAFFDKGDLNAGGSHDNMHTTFGHYIQTGNYEVFKRECAAGRAMVELIAWSPEGFHFTPGTTKSKVPTYGRIPLIPDNIDPQTGKRTPAFTPDEYEFYRYFPAQITHSPNYKPEMGFTPPADYHEDWMGRPDSGHFGIHPVTEAYHLTGDPTLLEGINRINEVLKFQMGHNDGCSGSAGARYQGWYQTGFAQIYNCNNDDCILPHLRMMADWTIKRLRTQPRGYFGCSDGPKVGEKPFFVAGLVLGLYNNFLLTHSETARESVIALNDWVAHYAWLPPEQGGKGGLNYMWESKLDKPQVEEYHHEYQLWIPAGGYLLTGRKDLLTIGQTMFDTDPNAKDRMRPTHQLWNWVMQHPRQDTAAPGTIKDLAVKPSGSGEVEITFTAPAGAAVYRVKCSKLPIVEFIQWPDQKETHMAFWRADDGACEIPAGAAGKQVKFTAKGLPAGSLYFAIKSYSAADNISELSNVVSVDVK